MKIYDFKFDVESGIHTFKMVGKRSISDILEFVDRLVKDDSLTANLKLISDNLDCEIEYDRKYISRLIEANSVLLDKHHSFSHAIVNNKPIEAAMSDMYKNLCDDSRYTVKVFSSIEAARLWLNNIPVIPQAI